LSEFARFMESISSEATETKINELSDVLNKVLQIITKALDDLTVKMVGLEEEIYFLEQKIENIQRRSKNIQASLSRQEVSQKVVTNKETKPPTTQTQINQPQKQTTENVKPVPLRSAVNTELKDLFKKLKK